MIDESCPLPGRAGDGWFKSSFSNGSGTCVEVRFGTAAVHVRDTKNRPPMLTVPSSAWAALVGHIGR